MRSGRSGFARGLAVTLAVFAVVFSAGWLLISRIGAASDAAQAELVEKAVRSAALTCYAVEGRYPMEISYLKENYGLAYDEARYLVFYDAFASNVMPEIRVNVRGEASP